MEFTKSEAKDWAKQNLKGLEVVIFPSFTPDLQKLDEEGIRYDVQHLADNGFKSVLCAIEVCGMTFEERKKFIEIVCDEARGKIHTSVAVLQDTVEQDMELLQHYEKAGGSVVMLGHPLQYHPRSEEGILRPDMVVHLPGQRQIIIDAKVPLVAYIDALETSSDEHREEHLNTHARHVKTHINQLSQKAYWTQFKPTPEFVILFIPGENFFSAALAKDPQLIELGVRKNVILATPTTLISLLKTVAFGWQQEQLAENAKKISELGTELFERLATMGQHINNLGRDIDRATQTYNKVVGSLERRVFSSARKFKELGITQKDENKDLTVVTVETTTRKLSMDDSE